MTLKKLLPVLALCFAFSVSQSQAQTLKNIAKTAGDASKVVGTITGHFKDIELEGTWVYQGAAVAFQSDNLLQKAGGAVAANSIENKLDEQLAKLGVTKGVSKYEFKENGKFTYTSGAKKLNGTYTYNQEEGTLTLKYLRLIPVKATLQGNSQKIEMLFDSSGFLSLVSFLGGISGNSIIKSITSIVNSYDGMLVGFELKKE